MKVSIYSKEGCEYCDHAKSLCESEGLEHEKIMVDKEKLKELCGGTVTTYPQIFIDGRHIGTYFEFQDYMEDEYEPILASTLNRFTVFPLEYPELWELYKKAQMSNWTAEEVDLSKDLDDWKTLNDNEQKFMDPMELFLKISITILLMRCRYQRLAHFMPTSLIMKWCMVRPTRNSSINI
jgi:glutaredoxin